MKWLEGCQSSNQHSSNLYIRCPGHDVLLLARRAELGGKFKVDDNDNDNDDNDDDDISCLILDVIGLFVEKPIHKAAKPTSKHFSRVKLSRLTINHVE